MVNMVSAKELKKYFDERYSDKNTAKLIAYDLKFRIKHGGIDPLFAGKWYEGISDGTIKILMDKGYIIRRSSLQTNKIGVFFKEVDCGIPYENNISSWE